MLTSILRTVVPVLWGSFIGWLISLLPVLEPLRPALLEYDGLITSILGAVIIAAWYAFWRWLEPKLPVWLVRAVLGSARAPLYPKQAITGGLEVALKPGEYVVRRSDTPSSKTPGPDHRA